MKRDSYTFAIEAECLKHGAIIIETNPTGGGHRATTIEVNGIRRKLFYPSSPSDHRGPKRAACDVRNLIRKMQNVSALAVLPTPRAR